MRPWLGGAIAAIALGALAPAAVASGPVYCVGEPSCPGTSLGEAGNGEQLQAALKKTGETPGSTLLIGAGNYFHAGGFKYEGGPATIRGAGVLETQLSDEDEGGATVLTVKATSPGATVAVSDLVVSVPRPREPFPKGEEETGLLLESGAKLEEVEVLGGGGNQDLGATILAGASFTTGAILMPETEGGAAGVFMFGGSLSTCIVEGAVGVVAKGATQSTVRGCAIGASHVGLEAPGGSLLAEDSLIDVGPGTTGIGVAVTAKESAAAAILRGLTIVGGERGLFVEADEPKNASTTATATLESSVIAETTIGWYVQATATTPGGKATARLVTRYSDLPITFQEGESGLGAAEPKYEPEADIQQPADFKGPLLGEGGLLEDHYAPAISSPLIDAGAPGPLNAGESETDLDGNPRIVHGRRDIGAFEFQWRAPTVSARATPGAVFTGEA